MFLSVEIVGLTPGLMTHNPASMLEKANGPRKTASEYNSEEDAERATYRTEEGYCAFPGAAPRACIVRAAAGFKARKGRGSLKTVIAHILVLQDLVPLLDPDTKQPLTNYEISRKRVIVQRQGIIRSRPLFPRWAAKFQIEYDSDVIGPDEILAVLADGGRKVGICEYRPVCGGPYGRFDVVK